MRIVDVCGFYAEAGGGVRSYVLRKFAAAARAGHDLTVIAPGACDRVEERPGGRIAWIASRPMPFDANYRVFGRPEPVWRVMDAAAPDVVEGSSPWGSGRIAAAWPGRAVRALVFHQDFVAGYPHTALDRWLSPARIDGLCAPYWSHVRRLSRRFDVTIAGGVWLARRLSAFGIHNPAAIPFGVEHGRFSPTLRDEALRRRLLARCGVGPDGRLLLAVGRLHPEKRHRTLIEAFALARRRRSDLALVLAGDGPARPLVERLAGRAGGVLPLGAVSDEDDLARLYASADLLVHGSAAETYGLVVAEALASGLPVVAPDRGGAADLAAHGVYRLYAPGDADGCAAAILDLLDATPEPGPGRATAPHRLEAHFDSLFDLYSRLILAKSEISV